MRVEAPGPPWYRSVDRGGSRRQKEVGRAPVPAHRYRAPADLPVSGGPSPLAPTIPTCCSCWSAASPSSHAFSFGCGCTASSWGPWTSIRAKISCSASSRNRSGTAGFRQSVVEDAVLDHPLPPCVADRPAELGLDRRSVTSLARRSAQVAAAPRPAPSARAPQAAGWQGGPPRQPCRPPPRGSRRPACRRWPWPAT